MQIKYLIPLIACPLFLTMRAGAQDEPKPAVSSEVLETAAEDLILIQQFEVNAPVSKVWQAYSTEQGWIAWASPKAKFDFRAGGTIRTHYGADAEVGDEGTITLNIVNYVPERLLTLRAELAGHFPGFGEEDQGNLMEITLFEALGEKRTRISSYGVGYRNVPAHQELLKFFGPANSGLYRKLIEYLEAQ